MKYIKTLFLMFVFAFLTTVCQAAVDDETALYIKKQVESSISKEVPKQVDDAVRNKLDSMLIDSKIKNAASEKYDVIITYLNTLQTEHDNLISHFLTIVGILITFLTALLGIFIPWWVNRNEKERNEQVENLWAQARDILTQIERLERDSRRRP